MRTSREREIDTTAKGGPSTFAAAGVRISGIDQIPMVLRHTRWPWPEDSIDLFGRDARSRDDGAQIFVEIYPLPDGESRFRDAFTSYRKRKSGFGINGAPFAPTFLLPAVVAPAYEHEGFPRRDGPRKRIVHVFKSPARAVILVYSLNSTNFAKSTFFRRVCEGMEIGRR